MKFNFFGALTAVALGAVPSISWAQDSRLFPWPASVNDAPVICGAETCPKTPDMPLYPYSLPLKDHVGRFVDSTRARDCQQIERTFRARGVKVVPSRDRVYMMIGSTMVGYKLSTFFTQKLGQPLTGNGRSACDGQGPLDTRLAPDAQFYAQGGGWTTPTTDSQDRLFEFDYDDRGYLYVAYSVWGWGVLKDTGNGFQSVKQMPPGNPNDRWGGSRVITFKHAGKYYAMNGTQSSSSVGLWDFTVPNAPVFVREVPLPLRSWTKISTPSGDIIAVVANRFTELRLYSGADLVNGAAPSKTFTFAAPYYLYDIAEDGTNFYGAVTTPLSNSEHGAAIGIFRPAQVGNAASYTESRVAFDPSIHAFDIEYGAGYLAMTVRAPEGAGLLNDLRVFRLDNGNPVPINLGGYFMRHYQGTYPGYAQPQGYTGSWHQALMTEYAGKYYLFNSFHGLGDVYEFEHMGQPAQSADLVMSAPVPSATSVQAGSALNYTIQASNNGPDSAQAVSLSFSIGSANATINSVSTSGWSCSNTANSVSCAIASLQTGLAPSILVNATAGGQNGTITASASIGSGTGDVNAANNSAAAAAVTITGGQLPAPTIADISPVVGLTTGGTRVTVNGANFRSGVKVRFGTVLGTSLTLVSPNQLTVSTPAAAAGAVNVTVINSDGTQGTLASAFTYQVPAATPTLISVTPNSGPIAGGTRISLLGTNFASGVTVTVGGVAATEVYRWNASILDATVPAHAVGAVDIVVTNPDGQIAKLVKGFTYTSGGRRRPVKPPATTPKSAPHLKSATAEESSGGCAPRKVRATTTAQNAADAANAGLPLLIGALGFVGRRIRKKRK